MQFARIQSLSQDLSKCSNDMGRLQLLESISTEAEFLKNRLLDSQTKKEFSATQLPTPVWTAVDDYINSKLIPNDEALEQTLASTLEWGLPPHNVAPNQGKMLQLIAIMCQASRILEIGTLAGYSTIWMARAIAHRKGAHLISLEVNPSNAEIARKNISNAGLDNIVDVRVGAATESLKSLVENGEKFDLIFIDADKPNNPNYIKYAISLSHKGTVIIADNVVRDGKIIDESSQDANVIGVRSYFDILSNDLKRFSSSTAVQTVGCKGWDGFCFTVITEDII